MWWGGGRRRDDDREGRQWFLEFVILIPFLAYHRFSSLAATLVQLSHFSSMEVPSRRFSVELTRNPQGMINALLKLDNSEPIQRHVDRFK